MQKNQVNKGPEKIRYSFKKEERLCSKKIIDKLFSEGNTFLSFPLKVVFKETELPCNFPVQVAFTVGKKNFKRAVHRNRIKRLMREAYRLNKPVFYDALGETQMAVFFIFIGKELPDYKVVELAMKKAIKKLKQNIIGKTDLNGP